MAWRGLPLLVSLLLLGPAVFFLACDDTGPSPIGDHEADPTDSGKEEPEAGEDAEADAETDAKPEAGDDDDVDDAGEDADADAGNDASKDAKADG